MQLDLTNNRINNELRHIEGRFAKQLSELIILRSNVGVTLIDACGVETKAHNHARWRFYFGTGRELNVWVRIRAISCKEFHFSYTSDNNTRSDLKCYTRRPIVALDCTDDRVNKWMTETTNNAIPPTQWILRQVWCDIKTICETDTRSIVECLPGHHVSRHLRYSYINNN